MRGAPVAHASCGCQHPALRASDGACARQRAPRVELARRRSVRTCAGLRVIKDNMLPVPPLFRLINECSGTEWSEMYKVFNCGHRMEVYCSPENAEKVIEVSKSFNIDAQVVGRVEAIEGKSKVTVKSEYGEFTY